MAHMQRRARARVVALVIGVTAMCAVTRAEAVTARWAYETAYGDGMWYRGRHNETATLAWGESYVMMSLASMYRATGDRSYLDRLAEHADAALAQRDDARGVTDYRGVSTACWRNTSYQDEPYCYAVHSGMIAYPIADLVRLIRARPELADFTTYDGTTYAAKASALLGAVEQVAAAHEDQFVNAGAGGNYIFRTDASFLAFAGDPMPLNQQNAMGRLLIVLWQLTGEADYLDKAERLATRLESALTTGANGEYLWNYWGTPYSAPGEDISHAAINLGFAAQAAAAGIVFDDADLEAFAATFLTHVYIDDATLSNSVGGGGVNGSSYKPQAGRWLMLAPTRPTIYQVVRNYYDADIDPAGVGSGSVLLGWAYLAEHEPPLCEHFFYSVDWSDEGDHQQATAYGANILTAPPDPNAACMVPLRIASNRTVTVAQWDGAQYHANAVWRSTGGAFRDRLLAYEPRWHHVYSEGADLYEFEDAFAAGDGVRVAKALDRQGPTITSTPATTGQLGVAYRYDSDGLPEATGDSPVWWSITDGPAGARADPATGAIEWTPATAGSHAFILRVDNDVSSAAQSFTVQIQGAAPDAGASTAPDAGAAAATDAGNPASDGDAYGCGCAVGHRDTPRVPWALPILGLAAFVVARRQRRRLGAVAARGSSGQ